MVWARVGLCCGGKDVLGGRHRAGALATLDSGLGPRGTCNCKISVVALGHCNRNIGAAGLDGPLANIDLDGPLANIDLGGGKANSASVLESIDLIEEIGGHKVNYTLSDDNRIGDHICYYSDLSKLKADYPNWDIRISLRDIIAQMVDAEEGRNNRSME